MRIYFMSICGTGMGNGALLMRALGHQVYGADSNTYPPMSDRLAEAGIEVMSGFDADRLERIAPDLVVVGNVNTRGNPEVEWLLEQRTIPFVSLPELLSREVLSRRKTVVVAGTHGKTTTTTIAAFLLAAAGLQPGYLIGGVPLDLPSGAAVGNPDAPFVIEGDEYDSAFFDKRSKFIHYCPRVLVLNNLEFDHADIFRDLYDIERSFQHLIKLVPRNGLILVNSDDPRLEDLVHVDWAPILRVGTGERADLRIRDYAETQTGSVFDLVYRGRLWQRVNGCLSGLFNARNAAMAALAAACSSGWQDTPWAFPLQALDNFRGVRRRLETLYEGNGLKLVGDFAHHPTAVRETLIAARQRHPQHRIVVAFEARSNTACRKIHQSEFEVALDHADEVHFGSVFRPERYSEAERIDFAGMAARLGPKARVHADSAALGGYFARQLADLPCGDLADAQPCLLIFFSNGSFDRVPQQLVAQLNAAGTPAAAAVAAGGEH